ncbi:SEC-C metal-binding domain-containing protein [Luteolibacter arcticus]|uniref:SEC-C metal-binding domain-containing protein n=1 Tax=Luteolibacter arcticus TaxID=1581411 RepID=UPI0031BAB031
MKRGERIVRGEKELHERLGRNDPCPCGSPRRFQELLHADGPLRWLAARRLLLGSESSPGAA